MASQPDTRTLREPFASIAKSARLRSRGIVNFVDGLVRGGLGLCGLFSLLVTGTIIVLLFTETLMFFGPGIQRVSVRRGSDFTLQYGDVVTPSFSADASPSDIESGLRGIEGLEPVSVTGEPSDYRVNFRTVRKPLKLASETVGVSCEHVREQITLADFIADARWSFLEKRFGIWPLICGTLLVTVVAMAFALPLGLVTAIYLSEYAPARVRSILKPTLEVLAGIPTVVYGFFALVVITPSLQTFIGGVNGYNALAAGIAVGILCLPTVCSLAEDALQAVPRALREGAYGLGATKFEVSIRVVLPAALSGIISAVLLAVARAVGETMIVALAAGQNPKLSLDPRQEIQTMTGFMVQMVGGDVSNFGVEYRSMYAVAATLFIMTFVLTLLGQQIRRRFREGYQ